jgi:hypothetical protein
MRRLALPVLLALLVSGCLYSFSGGGLPRHIRTLGVVPFQYTTTQPLIESEVETRIQQELPRSLGVRLAAENAADAVVRGKIVGYEEVAASIRPGAGQNDVISVVQRQVRITYEAEIYDLREDRPLWRAQGQSVIGNFQPDSEGSELGRTRAIQELVQKIIEGAQSQW